MKISTFTIWLNKVTRWSWKKLLSVVPQKQRDRFFKNRTSKRIEKSLSPYVGMVMHSSLPPNKLPDRDKLVQQLRDESRKKLSEGLFFHAMKDQVELNQAVMNSIITRSNERDESDEHLLVIYPNQQPL